MENDFLKELEYLGITARLKRMSDSLSYSIRDLYKSEDVDIEPSWHLVFLLLKRHKTRTMTEISEALHISQPAIVKMINKMKKRGYLDVINDSQDNRKKQLHLSKKALNELPKFERIWDAGQQSIKDILATNNEFIGALEKFEKEIERNNFKDRALTYLQND